MKNRDEENATASREIFEVEVTEFRSQINTCISREERGRKR